MDTVREAAPPEAREGINKWVQLFWIYIAQKLVLDPALDPVFEQAMEAAREMGGDHKNRGVRIHNPPSHFSPALFGFSELDRIFPYRKAPRPARGPDDNERCARPTDERNSFGCRSLFVWNRE